MEKQTTDRPTGTGWTPAVGGVLVSFVGGLFVAQAGGSDRETFPSIGFLLGAVGLLAIGTGGGVPDVRPATG